MKWVIYLKDSVAPRDCYSRTPSWPGPTLQPSPFGPLALEPAFHLSLSISLTSPVSRSNQESIALSQGTHTALTPVDTTKKVYYMAVISITAEQLRSQNGGRQAEESSEDSGGDRLRNSNSEQHVWLTRIPPLGSSVCNDNTHTDTVKWETKCVYVHQPKYIRIHIYRDMSTENSLPLF